MDTKELAARYISLVDDELKLKGMLDEENDVLFQSEEFGTMFFSINPDDPEYMMLIFPNFADLASLDLTKDQLLVAINIVNGTNKAAKLFVPEEFLEGSCDVTATVECFLAEADTAPELALLRATVRRNISALLDGARSLFVEAEKIKNKSQSKSKVLA
jgi:hypothetical protein